MPRVTFTANIQRHVTCPDEEVEGESVRAALDVYFARHARARGYVLDDQGAVRAHMVVFVDDCMIQDRTTLSDPVPAGSTISVFQALSGG